VISRQPVSPKSIAVLALFLGACARHDVAAKDDDIQAESVLVVHPRMDNRIRYVDHEVGRTADGRMSVVVRIASRSWKDRALIAHTTWFDKSGRVVEQSTPRTIVVPTGGTYVFEDQSFSTDASRFNVALNPNKRDRDD